MQSVTQPASLADKAYTLVESLIVTLALPPGHIFSEAELSRQIDIGRTPLREALQRLAAARLVKTLPRKGMMIAEISMTDHFALLETRRVLEKLVATLAAKKATTTQRTALQTIRDEMESAAEHNDLATFMTLDRTCDTLLESASKNLYATTALAPLHAHCRRFWYQYQHEGDLRRSAALHMEMIAAVVSGDEQGAAFAADAILDYLDAFTRKALNLI
ncbi:MAG: GntR family transcriptional regulator [Bacteroidota bacterium]